MIYIHFIVNPVAGNGKHTISAQQIRNYFTGSGFRIETDFTKHKSHAGEIARRIIIRNPDIIVACGGDGTVSEVASVITGTGIKLGIIPTGSGNGLAANLKIDQDPVKAFEIIRKGKVTLIDVGKINDRYFFSNAGVGFDAMVIKKIDKCKNHSLISYLKMAVKAAFQFKPIKSILYFDNKILNINQFMVFISNTNQMGYKLTLTPYASLTDGFMNLVIIPELSIFEKIILGYRIVFHESEKFTKAQQHLITNLKIEMPHKIYTDVQIDGEHHNLKTNVIEFSMISHGLSVIIP